MKEYNITSLPAVAVNGKFLSFCKDKGVSKEELVKTGVSQA